MSATRKLAGVLVLASLLACAGNESARHASANNGAAVQAVEAKRIYEAWGCGTCHGAYGAGGPLGPALTNLAARWSRERLIHYLKDPAGFRATERRLQELSKRYAPVSMPAFTDLDSAATGALADYLLNPAH